MTSLAATATLSRLSLRLDRVRLPVWIVSVVALVAVLVPAIQEMYKGQPPEAFAARAKLMRSPAAVLFSGPGFGIDHYSVDVMVPNELMMSVLLCVCVMNILLVVRHTRADEEAGRVELVRACGVGAGAPIAAVLLVVTAADVVIGAGVGLALTVCGLPVPDSMALGIGTAATGMVFAAITALCAQLVEHSRAATGLGVAVLLCAVALRTIGDSARVGGTFLSWLSPLDWPLLTRPYVDLRWWPLALSVIPMVVCTAGAYALAARRDVGAGLVQVRPGRPRASRALRSPLGLVLRQQRFFLLTWTVVTVAFVAAFAGIGGQTEDLVADNEFYRRMLGAGSVEKLAVSFAALLLLYAGLALAAMAIAVVNRLDTEESAGRTELGLSTAASRLSWLGASASVASVGATLAMVLAGIAAGVSLVGSGDAGAGAIGQMVGAALNMLPGVLACVAFALLLYAVAPRLVSLAWIPVAYSFVMSVFGPVLELPGWTRWFGPLAWPARMPEEPFNPAALIVLALATVVFAALAFRGFARRDVG